MHRHRQDPPRANTAVPSAVSDGGSFLRLRRRLSGQVLAEALNEEDVGQLGLPGADLTRRLSGAGKDAGKEAKRKAGGVGGAWR